jgi:hypothetical protein
MDWYKFDDMVDSYKTHHFYKQGEYDIGKVCNLELIKNEINSVCYHMHNVKLSSQNIDYPSYQSKFGWCPMELLNQHLEYYSIRKKSRFIW